MWTPLCENSESSGQQGEFARKSVVTAPLNRCSGYSEVTRICLARHRLLTGSKPVTEVAMDMITCMVAVERTERLSFVAVS